MLIESNTQRQFWPEAIAASVYLTNRLPSSTLEHNTPLEVLSTLAQIPLALTLQPRVFGCSVFVYTPKHERTKLSPCAIKCIFVGYGTSQKGYRCFDPKSNRMFTILNCDFLETDYFFNHLSGQGENNSDPLSRLSTPNPLAEEITITDQAAEIQTSPISDTVQVSHLLISVVSTSDSPLEHEDTSNVGKTDPETDIEPISDDGNEAEICDLLEEQISEGVGGYKTQQRGPTKEVQPGDHRQKGQILNRQLG